jgi:hypothetical protein
VIVASLLLIVGAVALLALGLSDGSNTFLLGSILTSVLAAVALIIGARRAAAARAIAEASRVPGRGRGRRDRPEQAANRGAPSADDRGDGVPQRIGRQERAFGRVSEGRGDEPEAGAGGVAVEQDRTEIGHARRQDAHTGLMAPVRDDVAQDEAYGYGPAIPAQGGADGNRPPFDGGDVGFDGGDVGFDGGDGRFGEEFDEFDEDPPDEPSSQHVSPADAARVARMSTDVLVIDGRPRYHQPGCVHLLGRESEPLPVREAVDLGFSPCGLCEPDSALLAEARRV